MKQLNKKNAVLVLIISGMLLGSSGCGKEPDVVFVNAQDGLQMPDTLETMTTVEAEGAVEVSAKEKEPLSKEDTQKIIVHVCGAVENSGVYELDAGSHVIDAVDAAGGLLKNAASDYMNLADGLVDGDKIWIPTEEEVKEMQRDPNAFSYMTTSITAGSDRTTEEVGTQGKININTADEELLCTLPGIGTTRAAGIIAYREEYGRFSSIEDIMNVSGIKESSFQKIKEYIVVN